MFRFPRKQTDRFVCRRCGGGVASESASVEAEECRVGQRKSLN